MNIKQALKKKNKLTQEIRNEFSRVQQYNSVVEGVDRVYDPAVALNNYYNKVDALIRLKTAIHEANVKVYSKIFRLSELKSMVSQLRGLDCTAGQVYQRGGYGTADSTINKTAILSVLERDQTIEKLESEIEALQEELDFHNVSAEISWTE